MINLHVIFKNCSIPLIKQKISIQKMIYNTKQYKYIYLMKMHKAILKKIFLDT